VSPSDSQQLTGSQNFSSTSVINTTFPGVLLEYVLQFSDTSLFTGTTYEVKTQQSSATGTITFTGIDVTASSIPAAIRKSTRIYWRIGARNAADNPGPVKNGKSRYVFSGARNFQPPVGPPPPPGGN
jgi:hypothetical protein